MVAENVVVLLMTSSRGYLIVLSTWFHFFFREKLFGVADIWILYVLLIEIIFRKKVIHFRWMIVKITALWSVNKVICRLVFSTSDQFLIMLYTYIVFPELGLQNCLIVVNKWDTIPNKNQQTATYYEQGFREKIHAFDWARIV